ncbi:MAG: hypothetical protein JSS91_09465 [Bacteroidetes bacterium]|nr:hypothetical protein [Bacteroidota bacterium]
MPEGNNKNIDSYLDDKISQTLKSNTSEDFMYEMMKRVAIEDEFAKEDRKTDKMAKFIIGGLLVIMAVLSLSLPLIFGSADKDNSPGFISVAVEKITGAIEYFSILAAENLGIAFNMKTFLVILISAVCIFIFSKADKMVLKKSYK